MQNWDSGRQLSIEGHGVWNAGNGCPVMDGVGLSLQTSELIKASMGKRNSVIAL